MAKQKRKNRAGHAHEAGEQNRREHVRVPLNLLVQVRSSDVDAFMSEHAPNISEGGMYLKTKQPRPEGTLLYFQLTTDDASARIEGLGRVVRCEPADADGLCGMGLEFVNLDAASLALVHDIVAERVSQ